MKRLRKTEGTLNLPTLKLWPPSYFAGSCGGAPVQIIRQYLEQQQTPH